MNRVESPVATDRLAEAKMSPVAGGLQDQRTNGSLRHLGGGDDVFPGLAGLSLDSMCGAYPAGQRWSELVVVHGMESATIPGTS